MPSPSNRNDEGGKSNNNNHDPKNGESRKKKRIRQDLDELEKEMGVAHYHAGITDKGQLRRKVGRKQGMELAQKRKLLEKEDRQEYSLMAESRIPDTERLRGSEAAFEEDVIQGSLVFGGNQQQQKKPPASSAATSDVEGFGPSDEEDKELHSEYDTETAGDGVEVDDNDENDDAASSKNSSGGGGGGSSSRKAGRRRMYKLGPFRSFKMAKRHGDAVAAHARGKSRLAIQKLKEVALDAPQAPQVYSSLGMVYQDMLKKCRERAAKAAAVASARKTRMDEEQEELEHRETQPGVASTTAGGNDDEDGHDAHENDNNKFVDPLLAEQCDLAKKVYGSYHAAAILCKRDFSLWVRAADAAFDVANIHDQGGSASNLSPSLCIYHSSEKKRWLQEAQRDYKTADKLQPPGIDVPAKLASIHMELGCLSESLTLLTDLKNRGKNHPLEGKRSEFHSSYKAWLLYSDLMLRIGHECIEWKKGNQTNDNYMFRRWLRKHSQQFDWQERRLQGLCLAFEAAAGTKNTTALFDWLRERLAADKTALEEGVVVDGGSADKDRWHVDLAEEKKGSNDSDETEGIKPGSAESTTEKADGGADSEKDRSHAGSTEKKKDTNSDEVQTNNDESPKEADGPTAEAANETQGNASSGESDAENDDDESPATLTPLEQEKKLVVEKQHAELEDFDKTTTEMDLDPESIAAKDRQSTRDSLVKSHEEAIGNLTVEYSDDKITGDTTNGNAVVGEDDDDDDKIIVIDEAPLPLSASCKRVCAIASELMKHLHGLQLYSGVRIVGEAVSAYFKERAAMADKRTEKQQKVREWDEKLASNPLMFGQFDKNSEEESSDEEEPTFLSDEGDMENDDDSSLLDSLRRGILPPELRVMYGLALLCEGGRNFVAAKCVDVIDALQEVNRKWLLDGKGEKIVSGNPLWLLFRRAMTEPLDRTSAYAFLADALRKTGKEQEWAPYFSERFRRHLRTLESVGMVDALMRLEIVLSPYTNFRKNQVLKVVLASVRFDVWTADCPVRRNPINRKPIEISDSTCVENVVSAISSLANVIHLVWKVEKDGSISEICGQVVKVASQCLRWLSKLSGDTLPYSSLKKVVEDSKVIVAFLSNIQSLNEDAFPTKAKVSEIEWSDFPIEARWQRGIHRPLSISAYNLSVACNVSLFSGWEADEFTLKLLRRRHGDRHFGVHIDDKTVTGFLPARLEEEISRQWTRIPILMPSFPYLNFSERVAAVKEEEWSIKELKDRDRANLSSPIAAHAEDDGLGLYLAFSSLSLRLAESETNEEIKDQLLQIALSIILPVSQFCVDQILWTSHIGEAAASLIGFDNLRTPQAYIGKDGAFSEPPKAKKRRLEKKVEKKVKTWLKGSGRPTLNSIVTIPTSTMKATWKEGLDPVIDKSAKLSAKQCMENVENTTKELRGCYTEAACEKISLQLAVALLEMASQPACHDPFTCLQHAAMFASQATKAGTSDMAFRKPIPDIGECTSLEALSILGRADCLHTIYFPNEAAFLCSYVARVCRLHRDREKPDYAWNNRWKVVAIYGYNLSVMIRSTVGTVLDKQMQRSFHSVWDRDVVEELERGRQDGWILKRSMSRGQDEMPGSESEADERMLAEHDFKDGDDNGDDADEERGNEGDNRRGVGDMDKVETTKLSYEQDPMGEQDSAQQDDSFYENLINTFATSSPAAVAAPSSSHQSDDDELSDDDEPKHHYSVAV